MVIRYMVSVDGSADAHEAFETALHEAKVHNAELLVLAVAEPVHVWPSFYAAELATVQEAVRRQNERLERHFKRLVAGYALQCHDAGVKVAGYVGTSNEPEKLIVETCKKKEVDCLVIGRRGLGSFKRIFLGSVSKYAVEHAPCTVIVAKNILAEETHVPIASIDRLEEQERKRRMAEHTGGEEHVNVEDVKDAEEAERKRREGLARVEAERHVEKSMVVKAEETERNRRVHEIGSDDNSDDWHHALDRNIAVMAEEHERRRRTQELRSEETIKARHDELAQRLEQEHKKHGERLTELMSKVSLLHH